jgi:hypothetical protein
MFLGSRARPVSMADNITAICETAVEYYCFLFVSYKFINYQFPFVLLLNCPPLWSSGQSSWLQIRRPGFDSRHYPLPQKKVMGLERGPLSLVSTTEELLDRKVAAPV